MNFCMYLPTLRRQYVYRRAIMIVKFDVEWLLEAPFDHGIHINKNNIDFFCIHKTRQGESYT